MVGIYGEQHGLSDEALVARIIRVDTNLFGDWCDRWHSWWWWWSLVVLMLIKVEKTSLRTTMGYLFDGSG